jgi:hypothetical protein
MAGSAGGRTFQSDRELELVETRRDSFALTLYNGRARSGELLGAQYHNGGGPTQWARFQIDRLAEADEHDHASLRVLEKVQL